MGNALYTICMGYSFRAAKVKGKVSEARNDKRQKLWSVTMVGCSWQRTNYVHPFPTPCAVTSSLLYPDTGPHHPTPIHGSSCSPCPLPPSLPGQPSPHGQSITPAAEFWSRRPPAQKPSAGPQINIQPAHLTAEGHPQASPSPSRPWDANSI